MGVEKVLECNMYTAINFIISVILTTFAIRMGDPIAIVLCLIGFLIMHVFCEEMDEVKSNTNYLDGIKDSNE